MCWHDCGTNHPFWSLSFFSLPLLISFSHHPSPHPSVPCNLWDHLPSMQTDLLLQTAAASAASYGNYISRYPAAYAIPYARDYAADPYHAAAIGPAAAAYGVRYPSIARVKSKSFFFFSFFCFFWRFSLLIQSWW